MVSYSAHECWQADMNQMGGEGGFQGGGGSMMSFSSYSSSSMGDGGEPHVVQYSSRSVMGPGGVRQTENRHRDSRTGVERAQSSRQIGDRGRQITTSRND